MKRRKKCNLGASMSGILSNAGSITPLGAVTSAIGGMVTDIISNKKNTELKNKLSQLQYNANKTAAYNAGINNAYNIGSSYNNNEDDIADRLSFKIGGQYTDRIKSERLRAKCGGKKKAK